MKDYQILVDHILESIGWIENYTKGISKEEFLKSVQIQDSVIRRLEIIGEAIGNFPEEIKKEYPDVKWKEISGMRNFLIHEYFGVSIPLIWTAIKRDIPVLKEQIEKLKHK